MEKQNKEYAFDYTSALSNSGFAKTILMLCVILGHSMAFWSETWIKEIPVAIKSETIKTAFLWINSIHTYGFALISGFVFAHKMESGHYERYGKFIQKKILRLIVPYFFVALIWVAPIDYILFTPSFPVVVERYLFGINPSQLWFLWMLFDIFAIAWPLWRYIKDPRFGFALSMVLFCVGKLGSRFVTNYFCIFTALQYFVFFYIGIQLRLRRIRILNEWWKWFIIHLGTFIVYIFTLQTPGLKGEIIRIGILLLVHSAGAIFAFLTLTRGRGRFSCRVGGYRPCRNAEAVIEARGFMFL